MASPLPYINSPGTIDTAFKRMREAATPSRYTNDFVSTVLQIKGGTGGALPPLFKKLGFLKSDGTPSPLYDRFRNDATSRFAVAEAVRVGYKPLYEANEFAHKLGDTELKGLILQVTGLEKGNRVAQLVHQTFKKLVANASFDTLPAGSPSHAATDRTVAGPNDNVEEEEQEAGGVGRMRLTYTISLNLPATTNVEVFNAIFRSLKENLIDG